MNIAERAILGARLARKMVPDRRLALISTVRAAIGLGIVFGLEPLMPGPPISGIVDFLGKTMCFFALYGLIGHAERTFMDAVVRNVERTTGIQFNEELDSQERPRQQVASGA